MTTPANAGVIAPPPLLLLAALIIGFALDRFAPLGVVAQAPAFPREVLGWLIIVLALAVNIAGFRQFQRRETPVVPYKPAAKLVTDGVFAHIRNPMYFGMIALPLGLGLILGGDWLVICAILLALVLHYGVVRREERYLEAVFGEPYRAYKRHVPRYGWRFD